MKKDVLKKIVSVTLNVLMYLFVIIALFALVVTLVSKNSQAESADGTAIVFGYQLRLVETASMEKCEETDVSDFEIGSIRKNALIFVESVPADEQEADKWYSELKVGDVLTFRYDYATQVTITHRITDIKENSNGGYTIKLEGDNKNENAEQLVQTIDTSNTNSPRFVLGRVVGQSYPIGLVMTALKAPVGLIFIIMIPCVIIIILEVMKIISVLSEEKKKKKKEEDAAKDMEIEELKARLEALESAKQADRKDSESAAHEVTEPMSQKAAENTDTEDEKAKSEVSGK